MRAAAIAGTALLISGCATSTANYFPAENNGPIPNTATVNKPFDQVWDSLVKQLSSDFFVINNIDKNSRLINLSFTASKPSTFIDCGRSVRTFKNLRLDDTYDYLTADSAAYNVTDAQGRGFAIRRDTKLEGRSNIYVAPSGQGTDVTVNTKYVFQVAVRATNFVGQFAGTETNTTDFSTKEASSSDKAFVCRSKGEIERRILNMVSNR